MRAAVGAHLAEHVLEGVGGNADLAAVRKVELCDQGGDDNDRCGEPASMTNGTTSCAFTRAR